MVTTVFFQYFKTKPFACDPSCLPKYPPSKEIDANERDDAKRQRQTVEKQERQESQAIPHKRKYVPPIKANHLSVTIEVSNCEMVLNFQGHNGLAIHFLWQNAETILGFEEQKR